jgi:hypothetical protein
MDCCNGTGLADFAAVPCPNPDCPAQRKEHAVSNDWTDIAQRIRAMRESGASWDEVEASAANAVNAITHALVREAQDIQNPPKPRWCGHNPDYVENDEVTSDEHDRVCVANGLEAYNSNNPAHRLREYIESTDVLAEVFKPSGKWMYSVRLDYSNTEAIEHLPSHYIEPVEAAILALRTATRKGTSQVSFDHLTEGWHLFVPDPPGGCPVMVTGGFKGVR